LDFDLDLESDELEVKLLMEELKELFPFFNVCGVIGREYALALVSVVDRAGIISSSFSLVEAESGITACDALVTPETRLILEAGIDIRDCLDFDIIDFSIIETGKSTPEDLLEHNDSASSS